MGTCTACKMSLLGEPNNLGGMERCVELRYPHDGHSGDWNDRPCNQLLQYLCQTEPLLPPPCPTQTCPPSEPCPTSLPCPTTPAPLQCPTPSTPPTPSPVIVRCSKGLLQVPTIDLDNDPIETTTAEFIGDQTNKCRNLAYRLHRWTAEAHWAQPKVGQSS